mmetsp:Transcript_30075/g.46015  ORF Transcript_30075/g.46015 Transcript_30075/m.46015 type:complete len:84 (-) Transcript_30075:1504-1755(-)
MDDSASIMGNLSLLSILHKKCCIKNKSFATQEQSLVQSPSTSGFQPCISPKFKMFLRRLKWSGDFCVNVEYPQRNETYQLCTS